MRTLCLFTIAAAVASAQTGPEILKKVAETYRSLNSYHFEAQLLTETVRQDEESRSRATRIAAAVLPDRRRLENKGGAMAAVRVYDGKTVWEYRPGPKQYARQDQATYKPPRMNTLNDPVDSFKNLDKMTDAKLLREETVDAAGAAARPCWVIEVPNRFPAGGFVLERSPTTYWIDKSTNLVLKQTESMKMKPPQMDTPQDQKTSTTYVVARINEPVSDDLFEFKPPSEAAEISEFTSPFGGVSALIGKRAPEITLQDLAGNQVTLESFRGKPVVLNFWATWCVPCREQTKKILEAQQEVADSGLVVLAINYGEDAALAKKYIDENQYTFPALLDPAKAVAGKYSVSSIPVVVLIDREGQVRAHHVGYSSGLDLREEFRKISR